MPGVGSSRPAVAARLLRPVARCSALAALLLVAACGAERPGPAGDGAAGGRAVEFAAEVVGVRPGADPRTLLVQAELPAGGDGCAEGARPTYLEESAATVWVNVVYTSRRGSERGDPCPEREVVEVPVTLAGPLASRDVSVNGSQVWGRQGGGYVRCDAVLGCRPPADHCDPLWVDRAVLGLDVAVKRVRGVRTVLGCTPEWLVLDLNRAVGNCPPEEGGACAEGPVQRVFLRWAPEGWRSVASADRAGCAQVRQAVPRFPPALCRDLAAPGSG